MLSLPLRKDINGWKCSLLPTMEIELDIDHISILLKLNRNEDEPLTLSLFLPGFSAVQFSSVQSLSRV